MAELRITKRSEGHLSYQTESHTGFCFDIEVLLDNGDIIEMNVRENGCALHFRAKHEIETKTILKDVDY